MIIRFIGEVFQNLLAVILILAVTFVFAKNSKRFRRLILPFTSLFVGGSFLLILLHKNATLTLSSNYYSFFYNFLTTLLVLVKSINYILQVLLFNILSLTGLFKVLMMANIQEFYVSLILCSSTILNSGLNYTIKFENQDVLEWFINFGSNKNLHTFTKQRVVFNC